MSTLNDILVAELTQFVERLPPNVQMQIALDFVESLVKHLASADIDRLKAILPPDGWAYVAQFIDPEPPTVKH